MLRNVVLTKEKHLICGFTSVFSYFNINILVGEKEFKN